MKKIKNIFKNLLALFAGIIFSLVLAEVILHFYNPLPSRFRGNVIQLKTNVYKKIVIEPRIAGLDSEINYSNNSLGFRGANKPDNFDGAFSIMTMGGSTTECSLLDDNKTWTALLGQMLEQVNPDVWINNAGMDGSTTYGHNVVLDDYILKLKPDMILFMVGINDRGKKDFSDEESNFIDRKESFVRKLVKRIEVANLINNLYLMYKTHQVNLGHQLNDPNEPGETERDAMLSAREREEKIQSYREVLPDYRRRVEQLAYKCQANGIRPVFITQALLSKGLDWEIMQLYNQTVMQVCQEKNLLCIDLGNELEKNKAYFYDDMHFTNLGAEVVAEILYQHLKHHVTK